jgi:hypothetical protein
MTRLASLSVSPRPWFARDRSSAPARNSARNLRLSSRRSAAQSAGLQRLRSIDNAKHRVAVCSRDDLVGRLPAEVPGAAADLLQEGSEDGSALGARNLNEINGLLRPAAGEDPRLCSSDVLHPGCIRECGDDVTDSINGRDGDRGAPHLTSPPAPNGQEVLRTEPEAASEERDVELDHPERRRLDYHAARIAGSSTRGAPDRAHPTTSPTGATGRPPGAVSTPLANHATGRERAPGLRPGPEERRRGGSAVAEGVACAAAVLTDAAFADRGVLALAEDAVRDPLE